VRTEAPHDACNSSQYGKEATGFVVGFSEGLKQMQERYANCEDRYTPENG
jgi:hypothetical protein